MSKSEHSTAAARQSHWVQGLLACLALVLFSLWCCSPGLAQGEEKGDKEAQAREGERQLLELTEKERALHADLEKAEKRIKEFEANLKTQETALATLEAEEDAVLGQYEKLAAQKRETMDHLETLLKNMWPLHLRARVGGGGDVTSWDAADREFVWLAGVYEVFSRELDKVREQEAEIHEVLEKKQALARDVRAKLKDVNKEKDALLAEKLGFANRLREVRQQRLDKEAEVNAILAEIEALNYKLEQGKSPAGVDFADLKGQLPWPIKGKVVKGFNLKGSSPHRGIGLSVADGGPVTAVYWGKVVHDSVLRGFGRVVILVHEGNYYSIYAYLSESNVSTGQEVAKGQVLGKAGYYPETKGPGLYFELRFGQKAINPVVWLVKNM